MWGYMYMKNSNFNILAFDGGGLKGALSISILERIVKEYPNLLNNINMFGGTSTGSLIALGLAYGVSPKEIKSFTQSKIQNIFLIKVIQKCSDQSMKIKI